MVKSRDQEPDKDQGFALIPQDEIDRNRSLLQLSPTMCDTEQSFRLGRSRTLRHPDDLSRQKNTAKSSRY